MSSWHGFSPEQGPICRPQLAYEGGLYVLTHNGILTRFDVKTGVPTYKTRIGEGGEFTSSPWAYNGTVFCMDEEGRTFIVRASEVRIAWLQRPPGNGTRHAGARRRSMDPADGETPLQHPKHTGRKCRQIARFNKGAIVETNDHPVGKPTRLGTATRLRLVWSVGTDCTDTAEW
jgi:hypothetical protein